MSFWASLYIHFSKGSIFLMLLSLPFLIAPKESQAQFYNGSDMSFGKNRIQWHTTIWTYYQFDHFDTYFYLNGKELALYTAAYANEQIPLMERRLQSSLTEKIQFIVFNSLSDLKQSNIGLEAEQKYNTGGITHIIGSKVFLYFDGNYLHFEAQIRAGIADMLLNQLMYGGSMGSQIKNTALFQLPGWYKTGLLSYLSEDWNTLLDSRLSQGILTRHYQKLNKLTGQDARIAGHSLWRYIVQQYGPAAIPDIVHMTQANRKVDKGFLFVTGLKFNKLIEAWFAHQLTIYENTIINLPQEPLSLKYRHYRNFQHPMISPDERYLSYTTNDEGLLKLWILDLETGKKKKLFRSGYSSDEKSEESFPLTAWHPNGEILAFVLEEKGKIFLYFYNLTDHFLEQRYMADFQKISHLSYSGDGKLLALAAVRQGKPDVYIYNISSNSHKQITNDFHTDLDPVFINANSRIVFSSNRVNDSLVLKDEIPTQAPSFDLFSYDLNQQNPILKRLSNTPLSNEIKPVPTGKNTIRYLSDENGVYNLFEGKMDSLISFVDTTVHYRYYMQMTPLSHFSHNIIEYSGIPFSENSYIVMRDNDRKQKIYKINEQQFTTATGTTLPVTTFRFEQQEVYQKNKQQELLPPQERKRFRSVFKPVETNDSLTANALPARQGAFGISGNKRLSLLYTSPTTEAENTRHKDPKRRNYYVEYYYEELTTQVDFTYLSQNYQPFTGGGSPIYLNPGTNVLMAVTLKDLLEDYRLVGGVRLNTSLINNEYVLSYSNLKKRLDRHISVRRTGVENNDENGYTRTLTHQALYMLSWPFSEVFSAKGTAIYRNDTRMFLSVDQTSLMKKNTYENWGGLRGELVFDNSREIGMNLLVGTRGKVFGELYQLVASKAQNFVVLGFDMRHYERIHRNFIWANRMAGSTSFGSKKLIYYMGGVDNWITATFDQQTPIDYDNNYAYQTLATNMRGFQQNIRNGNSFLLLNSELRFPVFSYIFQNPISSNFIRNFQLVAFGDLGTAWTGWSPYNRSNSLYTSYIENYPLSISVEIQKDPIVGGIGLGARTTLFGYFIRADVAWGIEDAAFVKPTFYISFSLDF